MYSFRSSRISSQPNLKFYKGEIKSEPNGDFIDEIHKSWYGDYSKLERRHDYIQWLFPEESSGVNYRAEPLRKDEAEGIKADPVCKQRVYRSFVMMLDFWGIHVEQEEGNVLESTGRIYLKRSNHYKERYANWMGGHNNLRVCRCIKSLGMLGLEHLQPPFVEYLMHEIMDGQLRGCSSSFQQFWLPAVRNVKERKRMELIWKQWNKDKKRSVANVQWKHSVACMKAAVGESNGDENDSMNESNAKVPARDTGSVGLHSSTRDASGGASSEDEDTSKPSPSTNNLVVVTSDKFPFTPQNATDDYSVFDIDTSHVESRKRKRVTEMGEEL